jgi:hypothetical protein
MMWQTRVTWHVAAMILPLLLYRIMGSRGAGTVEAACVECDMVVVKEVGGCRGCRDWWPWESSGGWCHFVFWEHKHDQMVCALPQVYKRP